MSEPAQPSSAQRRTTLSGRAAVRLGWGVLLVLGLLLPLVGRAGWEGHRELSLAREAGAAGDPEAQIEHLGRAARWRVPGLGHDEEAIDALMDLAAQAEAQGERGGQRALTAYREVRRALLGTRGLWIPQSDRFHQANERIAVLMAAQEERFGTDVGGQGDPYSYHLGLLEEIPGPRPSRSLAAALAFVGWLAAVVGFFIRALDEDSRLRPAPAVRWGTACIVLLVLWMVALRWAGP